MIVADAGDVLQICWLCYGFPVSFWSILAIFSVRFGSGGLGRWKRIVFVAGLDVAGLSGACSGLVGRVAEARCERGILLESLVG